MFNFKTLVYFLSYSLIFVGGYSYAGYQQFILSPFNSEIGGKVHDSNTPSEIKYESAYSPTFIKFGDVLPSTVGTSSVYAEIGPHKNPFVRASSNTTGIFSISTSTPGRFLSIQDTTFGIKSSLSYDIQITGAPFSKVPMSFFK